MYHAFEVPVTFIFYQAIQRISVPSSVRKLFNRLKRIKSLRPYRVANFGLELGHHLSAAPYCVTNGNKIGQPGLFQTFQ